MPVIILSDTFEQFAQPFLVATALVNGRVSIADVDGLGSPEVLALSDRIEGTATASRAAKSLSISVRHVDGRSVTVEATDPIGSPSKPLSDAQFADKFRDCAGNAIRPLDRADVERSLETIAGLENVPDVRVLMAPFQV